MFNLKGSWRTTVAGWLVIVVTLCNAALLWIDDDPSTKPDLNVIFETITSALIAAGFLAARDNKVRSEDAMAK